MAKTTKTKSEFDITGLRFVDKEEERKIEHFIVKAKISVRIGKNNYCDVIDVIANGRGMYYGEFAWNIETGPEFPCWDERDVKKFEKIKKELMIAALSFYHQVLSTKRDESDNGFNDEEFDD